mmetsp:Transcript_65145/g.146314  ORF Transcript_65145/g.146314 Transcript_65145/m.146314 type:complete len:219 (+) Transcript_65145:80-736(+)
MGSGVSGRGFCIGGALRAARCPCRFASQRSKDEARYMSSCADNCDAEVDAESAVESRWKPLFRDPTFGGELAKSGAELAAPDSKQRVATRISTSSYVGSAQGIVAPARGRRMSNASVMSSGSSIGTALSDVSSVLHFGETTDVVLARLSRRLTTPKVAGPLDQGGVGVGSQQVRRPSTSSAFSDVSDVPRDRGRVSDQTSTSALSDVSDINAVEEQTH